MNKGYGKWEIIRELGRGGQGTVFLVKDTEKTGDTSKRMAQIKKSVTGFSSAQTEDTQRQFERMFVEAIAYLNPSTIGSRCFCAS